MTKVNCSSSVTTNISTMSDCCRWREEEVYIFKIRLLWIYRAVSCVNRIERVGEWKRERLNSLREPHIFRSLHPPELDDALRPANTRLRWWTCDYLHIRSLNMLLDKSPAAERAGKKNVKHKTHTHILYIHGGGHAWPSTASPEAKHVRGYLYSKQRSLTAFCFQATSNGIGSASQYSPFWADSVDWMKKHKPIGFLKVVRPSAVRSRSTTCSQR